MFFIRSQMQSNYDERFIANTDVKAYREDMDLIVKDATKAIQKKDINMPQEGDGYASIRVDRIGFENTIYYGDNATLLNKGIGHYMGSSLPGEGSGILLAGHNGTEFYKLRLMQKGDMVNIDTSYGSYIYQIQDTKIMFASEFDTQEIHSDTERLIMYCCYPFNSLSTDQRYFVYADYVSGPQFQEGS